MQAVIVTDQVEDRDYLGMVLRQAGVAVVRSSDLAGIGPLVQAHDIDLILLAPVDEAQLAADVAAIREVTQVPLLLLSDSLTEAFHCHLLDAGADLVIPRPYAPRLLARYAKMLLRRAGASATAFLPIIEANRIALDPATRSVQVNGRKAERLTPLEFRLLYLLMTNAGQVLSVDLIVERVWGYSGEGNRELVRGLVRRLRRKIEPSPNQPLYIHNLPGVGYRFTEQL
ncbi:MAG: response regulator transcription factor [Chloroflexota bacterium]|jgi:DNA-binding response OmpR family regulator